MLLAMLVVFPLVERSGLGRWLLNLLVVGGIISSIHRVQAAPRGVFVLAGLGVLALTGQLLHQADLWRSAALVSATSQAAFYAGAALFMSAYMLRDAEATIDELYAAAAAFLLLALAWASAYWCIEHVRPGAFSITHPSVPDRKTWFEFLYLSMTTLSTTGYGDIGPVSTSARVAVMIEQFVGVMYVALVISRLAGFAGRRRRTP
jgi:hypothetical protein